MDESVIVEAPAPRFIERLGGRKFTLTMLSLVGVHVGVFVGAIGADDYRAVMLALIAVYPTTNVLQKVLAK